MGPCSTSRTGASSQSPQNPCPFAMRIMGASERLQREMLPVAGGASGFEREGENVARDQRIDQRVEMAARRGVEGVEPALVVGSSLLDALLQLVRDRLAFLLILV